MARVPGWGILAVINGALLVVLVVGAALEAPAALPG